MMCTYVCAQMQLALVDDHEEIMAYQVPFVVYQHMYTTDVYVTNDKRRHTTSTVRRIGTTDRTYRYAHLPQWHVPRTCCVTTGRSQH